MSLILLPTSLLIQKIIIIENMSQIFMGTIERILITKQHIDIEDTILNI